VNTKLMFISGPPLGRRLCVRPVHLSIRLSHACAI